LLINSKSNLDFNNTFFFHNQMTEKIPRLINKRNNKINPNELIFLLNRFNHRNSDEINQDKAQMVSQSQNFQSSPKKRL